MMRLTATFKSAGMKVATVVRSARGPSTKNTVATATAAPATTAMPMLRTICRWSTGSRLVLSMATPMKTDDLLALLPSRDRHADVAHERPVVDRLEMGAEHGNQVVGLHRRRSRTIEAIKAFNPRCTLTFTADSDMPHRLAPAATLKPSSFTDWIARRILSGSWLRSLVRSFALSVPT